MSGCGEPHTQTTRSYSSELTGSDDSNQKKHDAIGTDRGGSPLYVFQGRGEPGLVSPKFKSSSHSVRNHAFEAGHDRHGPSQAGRERTVDQISGPLGYRLAKGLLGGPLRHAYDIDVDDIDRLPSGPAILAANHRSFMDSVFLASVVDRPVAFLAKAEYFDRRATAWIFRSTGQIPLRRGSPAGARKALDAARGVLDGGGVVGVYPEGSRSRDGRLHRGHLGPARLALASGAPIVPVGLLGTERVQAPDQQLPRLGKPVAVRFGSPFRVEPQDANKNAHLRNVTDRLMTDIATLCGQDYLDRFAPLVHA
jgi:1-acyl-sn-glycerol-3-phosphate acyltransferase